MNYVYIRENVLDDAVEALNEHATTLQALSKHLFSIDEKASHSAASIAQELWETCKELSDTRHRLPPSSC
ncbi:hypothetical protein DFO67_10285 [Modicisalibacter xianhensis]|uniref:Uncharacterized protein n=1 Tax=Modicisalibacter xianhensis TaxID=442341 RepID=A0A4R8FYK8_9GAMM|nr:hypothetical protein DFO67_10285 [Halomonas xianhensis]